MKGKEIISYLIKELIEQKLIEAAYLENNANRDDNLYLHLVIKNENKELFNKKIKIIFCEMFELTFHKEIESYYDFHNYYLRFNGDIKLFLLIEIDNYKMVNLSDVLFDKEQKLVTGNHSISSEVIGETFNHISYLLDIFNTAYKIKDIIKAMRILNDVNKYMLRFFNYTYLPNKVYHNYRECLNLLPEEIKNESIKIIKKLKIETLLECSKMMIVLLDEHVSKISIDVAFYINIDFYLSVKRNIFSY